MSKRSGWMVPAGVALRRTRCPVVAGHDEKRLADGQASFRAGNGTIIEPFLRTLKRYICLDCSFSLFLQGRMVNFAENDVSYGK